MEVRCSDNANHFGVTVTFDYLLGHTSRRGTSSDGGQNHLSPARALVLAVVLKGRSGGSEQPPRWFIQKVFIHWESLGGQTPIIRDPVWNTELPLSPWWHVSKSQSHIGNILSSCLRLCCQPGGRYVSRGFRWKMVYQKGCIPGGSYLYMLEAWNIAVYSHGVEKGVSKRLIEQMCNCWLAWKMCCLTAVLGVWSVVF